MKQPLHEQAGQAMTPLMAGYNINVGGNGVITSGLDASAAGSAAALPSVDPVELRRLNFQVRFIFVLAAVETLISRK